MDHAFDGASLSPQPQNANIFPGVAAIRTDAMVFHLLAPWPPTQW